MRARSRSASRCRRRALSTPSPLSHAAPRPGARTSPHPPARYGLGIYILNLFIGFISPQADPDSEGPLLPRSGSEEFRPYVGRVPEFKFWYAGVRAIATAMAMTLVPLFDVPVFWPILLIYFVALFALTMRNQIAHMIKYRYVPFVRAARARRRRFNLACA